MKPDKSPRLVALALVTVAPGTLALTQLRAAASSNGAETDCAWLRSEPVLPSMLVGRPGALSVTFQVAGKRIIKLLLGSKYALQSAGVPAKIRLGLKLLMRLSIKNLSRLIWLSGVTTRML